jgi:molybdate transport system ATP-binding protein
VLTRGSAVPADPAPGARPLLFSFREADLYAGERVILTGVSWDVREGEHWAVLGPNGAGKSTLLRAVLGDVPVLRGSFDTFPALTGNTAEEGWNPPIGWVSFELHRRLIAREEGRDAARLFSGEPNGAETAGELFRELADAAPGHKGWVKRVARIFELDALLDRPFHGLSTGEIRRLLVARAVVHRPSGGPLHRPSGGPLHRPRLLVLDEPFDGLDTASRGLLERAVGRLAREGLPLILVSHRTEELLHEITHVLGLRGGKVIWQGPRREMLTPANLEKLYSSAPGRAAEPPRLGPSGDELAGQRAQPLGSPESVVEMRGVRVRYGDRLVLDGLSWTMRRGERWCVRGPNGSGKSTLLSLICGDNPQAYANDIRLFGVQRGSGESVWDIKGRIGQLSTELQVSYRREASGREVLVSGFHDSIGIYQRPDPWEEAAADDLLALLGLEALAERDFSTLSGGEQRLLLLARAVIKRPELLVLDEPCQGLDPANRARILAMIDRIASGTGADLIYVSHHPDEMPASLTHVLELPSGRASALTAGMQSSRTGAVARRLPTHH